jgi:hypothetical protein
MGLDATTKRPSPLIVGLDATTKGPSPLVGESKLPRESKVSRSENNYFTFIRILHTNN